jgi:hypothetical protein
VATAAAIGYPNDRMVESEMRFLEHPEGKRLPALERNILKFRAFEMMLSLFYAV